MRQELLNSFVRGAGAGTYTVEVDGVGVGNPFVSPPSGYSDYASLGRYVLTGSITDVDTPEPDTTPPAAPTGVTASHADGDVTVSWNANGEPDLAGYTVARSQSPGGPFSTIGSTGATSFVDVGAPIGTNHYTVTATDVAGNSSSGSNVTSVVVPRPPVDYTRSATGETAVLGTVSGTFVATHAADGATQTLTEADSGGRPDRRHDRAEHRWSIPASVGNQTLSVIATASAGSDADAGWMLEYSHGGSPWLPLAEVTNGQRIQISAPIGAPAGDVLVRAVDTDRSRGNTSHNSLAVDFLEIVGDGQAVDPPTASMVVAALTTGTQGAGKGEQYAVATVTVTNDLGAPVGGAAVTVLITGDLTQSVTGTTNGSGIVSLRTTASAKRPVFTACVVTIGGTGGLPYEQGAESCEIGNSG